RRDLVHVAVVAQQSVFAFLGQCRMREEPKPSYAIVEAHKHQPAPRKLAAVVHRRRTAAIDEAAAIDPYHHRQLPSVMRRKPYVQHQAIFCRSRSQRRSIARKWKLHAVVTISGRVPHSRPLLRRLRWAPAQIANRRRGEWNSFEREDAVLHRAFQFSRVDADRFLRRCHDAQRHYLTKNHCRNQRCAHAPSWDPVRSAYSCRQELYGNSGWIGSTRDDATVNVAPCEF